MTIISGILTLAFLIWNIIAAEGIQMGQNSDTHSGKKEQNPRTDSSNHVASSLSNFQSSGNPYRIPIYFDDILYRPERKVINTEKKQETFQTAGTVTSKGIIPTTTTAHTPVTGTGSVRKPFMIQPTKNPGRSEIQTQKAPKAIIKKQKIPKHHIQRQRGRMWRKWKLQIRRRMESDDDFTTGERWLTRFIDNADFINDSWNTPRSRKSTRAGVMNGSWNTQRSRESSRRSVGNRSWNTQRSRESTGRSVVNRSWNTPRSRQSFRRSRGRGGRICGCMLYCENGYRYRGPCRSNSFPFLGNTMSLCCVDSFAFIDDRNIWNEEYYSFID